MSLLLSAGKKTSVILKKMNFKEKMIFYPVETYKYYRITVQGGICNANQRFNDNA